jgi:predicted aconitase
MFGTLTFGITFFTSFTLGMFDPSALPQTCTPYEFTQPSTSALARGGPEMEAASIAAAATGAAANAAVRLMDLFMAVILSVDLEGFGTV